MPKGDATRKIFFYRLLDPETMQPLDRKAICDGIEALAGDDVYFDDGESITRAEVYDKSRPQCIRFYKVRRDDLPGVDDGAGQHSDLDLEDEEGLAEAIHIRLFPNGVAAIESFGFGPRASRFGTFIRTKLDIPCLLRGVVRKDVVDEALELGDIRLVRIKLDPSEASQLAVTPNSLHGFMSTAENLNAGVWAELTLRSDRGDASFTDKVKGLLGDVFGDHNEAATAFERFEVEGKPDPDTPVAQLDLLSEKLFRRVQIPYRAERTRELDADAAFSALKEAYDGVKNQLADDAEG